MKWLPIIGVIVLFSCSTDKGGEVLQPVFTEADSLACVEILMDSLREEMMDQEYYRWTEDYPVMAYCGPRYFFSVNINMHDAIMVFGELREDSIPEFIARYFTANMYQNDLENNFPMYSTINRKQIMETTSQAEEEYNYVKADTSVDIEMIRYRKRQWLEWKERLTTLETIGQEELREVHYQAGVTFNYVNKNQTYNEVMGNILLGFYLIRNKLSNHYFNKSYARIYWDYEQEPTIENLNRLKALKYLQPVRIYDKPFLKSIHKSVDPPPPTEIIKE